MEYKVIIQENRSNGTIYMYTLPLESCSIHDALRFMQLDYHADCVFIPEYSLN